MKIFSVISIVSFLCFGAFGQKKDEINDSIDFISIEHIGVSDKPIKFIISYEELPEDSIMFYNRILKVDKDIFYITCSLLEKENTQIKKVERRYFGVFQIMYRQKGNTMSYLLPSREFSIEYFLRIKYSLDKEFKASKISDEIEKLLDRIRW